MVSFVENWIFFMAVAVYKVILRLTLRTIIEKLIPQWNHSFQAVCCHRRIWKATQFFIDFLVLWNNCNFIKCLLFKNVI